MKKLQIVMILKKSTFSHFNAIGILLIPCSRLRMELNRNVTKKVYDFFASDPVFQLFC